MKHNGYEVKIGDRIGAVRDADEDAKTINMFGYGIYAGEEIPPPEYLSFGLGELIKELGILLPKLQLDKEYGSMIVYGCECWWGSEEAIRKGNAEAEKNGFVINYVKPKRYEEEKK